MNVPGMQPIRKIYKPSEFAKLVGVSYKTLLYWDKKGYLTANRTITNRRYYTEEQLQFALNSNR